MKCENCRKNRADFIYTESINGKKKEIYLCNKCAHKLGLDDFNFNLANFFFDTVDTPAKYAEAKPKLDETQICKVCGFSFDDIVNLGKFGCSNCYDTFSDKLDKVFLKMHGKNRYKGKKLNIEGIKENKEEIIERLEKELKESVLREDYENAAKLRDEIKELKAKE